MIFYLNGNQNALPKLSSYNVLVMGSALTLYAQVISSSSSSWSTNEGANAPLYLGQVSIHFDHSNACVLNFIRDFIDLVHK